MWNLSLLPIIIIILLILLDLKIMNRKEKRKAVKNYISKKPVGFESFAQVVMSEPAKLLVEEYTTKSGQVKNKYNVNLAAKPVKTIYHKK